jgi:hypothetical protein
MAPAFIPFATAARSSASLDCADATLPKAHASIDATISFLTIAM